MKTVDLTLSASFDFGSEVSVGFGLIYERAEATLSKAIDFGSRICTLNVALCVTPNPVAAPYGPQKNDGMIEVTGDDTGIGFIAGMHIHPNEKFSLGFTHRSEIAHDIQGTADFTVPANVSPLLAVGAPGQFVDTGGGAQLTTPSVDTISVTYGITDKFTLMGDWSYTQWSSLKQVAIAFSNPRQQPNPAIEEFQWTDTSFASIGAEYALNDQWTLRAGYAQDQSPTNNDTRTPRLPDEDRQWLSLGATWSPSEHWEISAGYTRIETDDPTVDLDPSLATSGSTLTGTYSANVNLFGLSGQYRF